MALTQLRAADHLPAEALAVVHTHRQAVAPAVHHVAVALTQAQAAAEAPPQVVAVPAVLLHQVLQVLDHPLAEVAEQEVDTKMTINRLNIRMNKVLFWLFALIIGVDVFAQEVDDAVKLATPNGFATARSMVLGTAFRGICDDGAASVYNPAGLAIVPKNEFTLGVNLMSNSVSAEQFNKSSNTSNTRFAFNNIGIVVPFTVGGADGSRAGFAINYNRESNLYRDHSTDWYNENSSIVQYYSKVAPKVLYLLWLSPENNQSFSPIKGKVQQTSNVEQTGSMHNMSFAYGGEITRSFAIGGALLVKWGRQNFYREYLERDINNVYDKFEESDYSNLDFNYLKINESVERKISSVTGNIGMLWKIGDFTRLTANIKLPSYNEITFDDSLHAYVVWDNGEAIEKPYRTSNYGITYALYLPPEYSMGLSFHAMGATLSTGIEYSDLSSIHIDNVNHNDLYIGISDSYISSQNKLFRNELGGRLSWGVGAEYQLPKIPITLRVAYNSKSSPYKYDVDGATQKIYSIGAGLDLDQGFRIDFGMQYFQYNEYMALYGRDIESRYTLTNKPLNFSLNMSYRF